MKYVKEVINFAFLLIDTSRAFSMTMTGRICILVYKMLNDDICVKV